MPHSTSSTSPGYNGDRDMLYAYYLHSGFHFVLAVYTPEQY